MWRPEFLYTIYERNLAKQISRSVVPRHVGIILDGNRRWAKQLGISPASGHRKGANHVAEVLGWCDDVGIEIVTLWMLSTDNLKRAHGELEELIDIIVRLVEALAGSRRWRLRVMGDLSLLPRVAAARISHAVESTESLKGLTVNIAVGYGGRQEITQAVREYLHEKAEQGCTLMQVADNVTIDSITDHMYTKGQPDPDLIIRTSGEQRMSGFMIWQAVHTEFYFAETYWPDFRRTDFLRALRSYSQRERRRGK
ncbi:MAG: isoprenyl transferase [Arcanobacterium sp.]|nr:isoprenyl transferase [Arcanobacterium sp.]